MSKQFEESIHEVELQQTIRAAILEDREIQRQLAEKSHADVNETSEEELATFSLRDEVDSQMKLLKSIRDHFFYANGSPREETESSDITSYMANTTKLLGMLKGFEDSLKTDADVLRIETAIEMALEDCPCEDFVIALTNYLKDEAL